MTILECYNKCINLTRDTNITIYDYYHCKELYSGKLKGLPRKYYNKEVNFIIAVEVKEKMFTDVVFTLSKEKEPS